MVIKVPHAWKRPINNCSFSVISVLQILVNFKTNRLRFRLQVLLVCSASVQWHHR
uniref:Uncharacterized protein n=1 Tax=Anopheles arabiensis TaxID=7173 RepID=A0A182IFU0_ANOAR